MRSSVDIPFIDLKAQRDRLGNRIERAIARVIDHAQFVQGPEVAEFERQLSEFCDVGNVISCANGTDALVLALKAIGMGSNDAVFVPAYTFAATAEAPALCGATPFFVDVDLETFNMDARCLTEGIHAASAGGLRPAAVIAVDLFGNPADYTALREIADREGLKMVADAAQSIGGRHNGKPVGGLAEVTTTSFFPAKPLGCYGDGGAVLTDDDELAGRIRSLRNHGCGEHKYDHVVIGTNSRLDTIQAAILIEKLSVLRDEMNARESVADRYRSLFDGYVRSQAVKEGNISAWAQFTVVVDDRDVVASRFRDRGIPTAIYYPRPLHNQPAYSSFPRARERLPVSEGLANRSLSLPFHPYLSNGVQDLIVAEVLAAIDT